jgi:seryl-tRNA synthetase
VESFPQQLTLAVPRDDKGSRHALAPAVCYHTYPEWQGKTLGAEPVLLTARGRCYRYEGGHHIPLERLWEFSMREIIVLGTRGQVEGIRQALVRQVSQLVTTLGLDGAIELAADPFFTSGDEGRRLMQQAGALKYELQLTVGPDGRSVAAASFNNHHEFFGRRFGISLGTREPAHSGCVAFGLERWVLALLAQHGVDEHSWPDDARRWLNAERAHVAAALPGATGGAEA